MIGRVSFVVLQEGAVDLCAVQRSIRGKLLGSGEQLRVLFLKPLHHGQQARYLEGVGLHDFVSHGQFVIAVHDEVELVAEPAHHLLPGGAVLVDTLVSLGAVGSVGVRRLTGLPVPAACAVARERLPVESKGLAPNVGSSVVAVRTRESNI